MENAQINFVKPELSKTSTNEDVLSAIKQFIEVNKSISILNEINHMNYASFISTYRDIIKKNTPVVGKAYRVIDKTRFNENYSFKDHVNAIEYVFVTFVALKKDTAWGDFMPKVKCIPLDKDGKLIPTESRGEFLCVNDYSKGEEVHVSCLSKDDYPEISIAYKNCLKKKDDKEIGIYKRIQEKIQKGELNID